MKPQYRYRPVIVAAIAAAFLVGFWSEFERLHIFLFNLCCGGFTILYYTEDGERPGPVSAAFFLLSLVYALLAHLGIYPAAIAVSAALFVLVEIMRIRRFSAFPIDFFRKDVAVSRKFHQASLLCLSLALLISTVVILNDRYYGWIVLRKLTLDVFFLGFSFPVSLIVLSVMFTFTVEKTPPAVRFLEHAIFWTVNLGVIIFFVFILMEWAVLQWIIATVLSVAVAAIFILFFKYGTSRQQKHFLVSGIVFLLFTAVTGIAYILVRHRGYGEQAGELVLSTHSYLSLYGWNLSGIMVILRKRDFPIRFNSYGAIAMHWITVAVLGPLGKEFPPFSVAAALCFALFLLFFFTGKRGHDIHPL
jgi:hypothetical protein